MEFAVLGPLEVTTDDGPIPVGRGKQRALLALLIVNAGRVVPTERLIDELWGDRPPATAGTALQVYVSKLRKTLGAAVITTRDPGYVLGAPPDAVDLHRFEALVVQARGQEPARAAELLRSALALWRGPALADVELGEVGARLDELRIAALEERIELELALARHGELVSELEALVREHPLRERLRAQLMLALYRSGRQAEALDAYRAARRALVEELGIEPSDRLQRLEQSILRHDTALDGEATTVTATAVFVDLGVVGEIETVAAPALATATRALNEAGGRVDVGLADALVALFVDGDHPRDGIRAAIAVREALSEYGAALAPRFGVATADAVLGERPSGPAVVLAARRLRTARRGEIVAGERTASAARGPFSFTRRGDCYVLDA